MAKGEVKKWRKDVDGQFKELKVWRKDVDNQFKELKVWRKDVDGQFKELKVWRKDVNDRFEELIDWTKDMSDWRHSVDGRLDGVDSRLNSFKFAILALQEDVRYLKENMFTKEDREELMTKLDSIMGEIEASRREREIQGYRYGTMNDQVDDHEKRIVALEKKY